MKILAIIGARSGSKGVPDKNIKNLHGHPLMSYIIKKACDSKYINRVILSTDSPKYAKVGLKYGAEVPFLRPKELAMDFSPELDYIKYTLERLKETENYVPDIVIRLFPTVPFQLTDDIDKSIEILLKETHLNSCVVISESRQHPMKALKINDNNHLTTYISEKPREVTPIARQSYSKAFFRSNIITFRTDTLYTTNSLTGDVVGYHIIPQERSLDIDSEFDFLLADKLFEIFNAIKWEI